MDFDWDTAKHERNIRERGFGFDIAALIFTGDTIEVEDTRTDYGECRMQAIGDVDGTILFVVYTDRGDTRWIISARKANRRERARWHER
jgi:uncharacterized DUF497 family protein